MAAVVVTSHGLQQLAQTGKAEPTEALPPMRREVIALKRAGTPPLDPSVKVDDPPKDGVQANGAAPTARPAPKELSEEDLPEHARKVIGKKHREMKEATEFAEFQRLGRLTAEKRVQELEAQLAKATPAKTEEPNRAPADKPKPEDFANVAEYTDALTDWKLEQRDQQRAHKQAESEEATRQTKASETWQTRLAAVMESNPDFESVVTTAFNGADGKIAKTVIDYIEESEVGPQLLYHLANHADEYATFRSLPAAKAIGFLGRLEAKLEAGAQASKDPAPKPQAAAPVKKVSQAPAPIDTSVGSAEVVRKDPGEMTTQEYLAMKRSERKSRAR